ncbi:MAG: hypothetical protein ABI977_02095, partial [Acidobacteriota bacterium]
MDSQKTPAAKESGLYSGTEEIATLHERFIKETHYLEVRSELTLKLYNPVFCVANSIEISNSRFRKLIEAGCHKDSPSAGTARSLSG